MLKLRRSLVGVLWSVGLVIASVAGPPVPADAGIATTIVVLGGTGVVSEPVLDHVAGCTNGSAVRAWGANRYATAAAASRRVFGGSGGVVYVGTGENFPDALAGAPAAAANHAPILLVTENAVPSATARELDRLKPATTVILGGTAVVSDAVAAQLPGTVVRLAGANRYATAVEISKATFSPGVPVIYLATGENFPDALAGGAVAGHDGGPILLVTKYSVPSVTAAEIARLTGVPCSGFAFTPTTFGDGTWRVGSDIPPGTYRTAASSGCYAARLSGFGGTLGEIIANEFSTVSLVVTIDPLDAGFESIGCGSWTNDIRYRTGPASAPFGDGTWFVGEEIAPGLWRNSDSSDGCYWERRSGFSWELADIIANNFTWSIQTVSIASTDVGFLSNDCGTWTKIG